ncbi:hypothetical protein TCAL_07503 [Tigriopus californicus]|uniref:Lipase domain-containing protein n=1 Tax=Tigriopus californicus TaxID=6832 RepID=A0A553PD67_TIGCA|nr:hypothetical protein TCAL_07503 [Tigriopus californicus]
MARGMHFLIQWIRQSWPIHCEICLWVNGNTIGFLGFIGPAVGCLVVVIISSFNLTEASLQNSSRETAEEGLTPHSLHVPLHGTHAQFSNSGDLLEVSPLNVNLSGNSIGSAPTNASPNASTLTGVFLDPNEPVDEENDAKLFTDMINSVKEWQIHKLRQDTYKRFSSKLRYKRDEEVVCYGDLGCFRDEGPFDYLDMLPSPPEEIQTTFFLYTSKNKEISQILTYNNATSVQESNFNASNPLKIIIHGFGSGCNRVWPREMRLSFLAVEDCNVICVDWSLGAADPNYVRAAVNTRLVGKQVAILMKTINDKLASSMNERTHIIGFSLGAHVAGFAGSELSNLSRITGLDPAGPLFEGYDLKVRLDKSDANYVDVIHSNGESLIVGGFGVWEPIGHVDFYPNGGRAQRGCQHLIIGGLYDFIYSYSQSNETYRYLCNHRRAYKLFTNSISPKCKFNAFPCESYEKFESGACFSCNSKLGECGHLGYYSNQAPGRGSLYLLTRDEEPFCGNQYKINIMFTGSRLPLYTYGRLQLLFVDKDGLNETHLITEDVDDLLTSGSQIEKLLVGHPAIIPVEVHILYVAYDGWIYSGRFQWSLDKLVITDELGTRTSFCKENGQHLPSGIPVKLKLKDGDCIASTLKVAPEYPLVPYRRYPNKPYDHLPHHKILPVSKKGPPENKIVASSGQDGLYITNAATSDAEVTITINDEVAPKSVPSQIVTFNNGKEVVARPVKIYRNPPDKILPPLRALPKVSGQGHPHLPKIPHPLVKWPVHHQYAPHHSSYYGSAPGPWTIGTPRPVSIPPPPPPYHGKRPPQLDNGIEVRYGPKFPTPPSHPTGQFPARRRPSTQFSHQRPIITHRRPPIRISSPDSIPSGTRIGPQYHSRPMDKSDHDVTELIDTSNEFDSQASQSQSDEMKMEFMSDDQLTIVKIGTEDELNRSNNNSIDLDTDNQENNTKIDYIVFHKLPNGEALNLENLKTYNMSDIAQGKVQDPELGEIDMAMFDQPEEEPRGFNTFNVNEGNDALRPDAFDSQRIHSLGVTKTMDEPESGESIIEDDYYDQSNQDEELAPDPMILKISTQAPPEEEVYNPTPLKDLEDLDAMPFQGDKPVYIIHEKDLVKDHPYFTSFKNKHVPRMDDSIISSEPEPEQADMEILKVNVDRKDRRIDSFQYSSPSVNSPVKPEPTKMTFDWVPIPTNTPIPIFGPRNKPSSFKNKPIDVKDVQQMTNIASVAIANKGPLAEEVNNSPVKDRIRPISLQYLPKRFTTILSRITDKERSLNSPHGWPGRPGQFRENKIAPIFKQDPMGLGLERNFARAIPHQQFVPRTFGPPRHSRRITGHFSPPPPPPPPMQPRTSSFQTQFIPNTASSRYIPIHPKQSPKQDRLWWEPQPTETVSDTLEAPKALIRDTIHVDAPRIVPYSSVEISSAQSADVVSTERTLSMIQEEDQDMVEESPSTIITSTEGKIVRMQEPFVPPSFVPERNDSSPRNATTAQNTNGLTKELSLEIKARVISENIKGEVEETTTTSGSKKVEQLESS